LDKAFTGARAWHERGHFEDHPRTPEGGMGREGVVVDERDKTFDGFTLFTTTQATRATLIDMRGNAVHHWEMPFRQAWPRSPHVSDPLPEDLIHWFRCHLFPNGDLLAIYHSAGDTPYGYGLVKLDRDSRLLWAYAANVHHDVDVGEDGTIYTLVQKLASKPPRGLEFLPAPYIADSLVVLSPQGRELASIPILEAFRDSPYALTLNSITGDSAVADRPRGPGFIPPPPGLQRALQLKRPPGAPLPGSLPRADSASPGIPAPAGSMAPPVSKGDLIHANSVKVLRTALAPRFPLFKSGQVLISLRSLDTIAVLDTRTRCIVWAARGIWRIQHDPEFLDNGHLLLYDNGGSAKGCRVLEYDPLMQAIPWAYASEDSTAFQAPFRGMKQRLPNGNTLIVDPDNGRIFEVTLGKELAWEAYYPRDITGAQRFGPDDLPFLKGVARERP
jgi:hypothetical protein